jgi:fermentation-respiration switch protein FrsA (DUF1100 family)
LLLGLLSSGCNWFIESQVFFPDKTIVQTPAEIGLPFEDIQFNSSDGVGLHGWLVPASPPTRLLLFCHGNAGNISHRLDNIRLLHQSGISVLIFDYRGYGRSQGRISEEGFYLDSEAAHQVAAKWVEQHKAKLVIFGRSLGGIAAVHLGANGASDGLILESTFTNMGAMARALNAVGEIGRVKVPILFVHGDKDRIVPIRLGQKLYEAASHPKEFYTIAGAGHNDTYVVGGKEYFDKIKVFLEKL